MWDWTSRISKNFSVVLRITLFVFTGFLVIISIHWIKRDVLTTHRSDPIDPNVSYRRFFKGYCQYPKGLGVRTSKREFQWNDDATSMSPRKFSMAFYHTLFVFAGSPMIISISRNKREGLSVRRSDFAALKVTYWSFFKLMITWSAHNTQENGVFEV